MTKRWMLTMAAVVAVLLPAPSAPAQPASASAAPAATLTVAATATTSVALARDDGLSLDADPPGPAVSKAPTVDEWKSATKVKLPRSVPACAVTRVREWLKVHCSGFPGAGVSLLAGPRDGVVLWVDPSGGEGNEAMTKPRDAELVFPLRRGDGRLFQVAQFGEGYDGPIGWNNAYAVSEYWAEGDSAPVVTIR